MDTKQKTVRVIRDAVGNILRVLPPREEVPYPPRITSPMEKDTGSGGHEDTTNRR